MREDAVRAAAEAFVSHMAFNVAHNPRATPALDESCPICVALASSRPEPLDVDRSKACPLDPDCYRFQGHDGEHMYGDRLGDKEGQDAPTE